MSGDGWSFDTNVPYYKGGGELTITEDYEWAVRDNGKPARNAWYEFRELISWVSFANGVTSIGDDAFAECSSPLVDLNQVQTIGKCAFKGTNWPKSWPASLTSIGDSAFYSRIFDFDSKITLRAVVPPTLGKNVFSFNSSDGVNLFVPGESLAAYKASEWAKYFVIVPESIDGDGWSLNGDELRITADFVWAVRDNGTPARNPWYEFRERINTVRLGIGVTAIGDDAFAGFKKLRSVVYNLETIKTIGRCAFKDTGLNYNTIPCSESLTSIGDSAFWGTEFDKICYVYPNQPPSLGKGVFSMTPDNGVQLRVPEESLESYEASDWANYFNVVPQSISGDGWSFSLGSRRLTITGDYVWPVSDSGTPARNSWYEFEGRIYEVILEDGVTSIGDYAFAGCENMDWIAYRDAQIKTIGKSAFKGLRLSGFFPENCAALTSIGDSAFWGSYSWSESFYLDAKVPPTLGKGVFSFAASDSNTLIVPSGSVAAYEASDWAKYFVIKANPWTAIDAVPVEAEPRPKVVNGVVTVGGEPAREVYSLSGRRMPAGVPLSQGIYVVVMPTGAVRVAVK